MTCATYEQATGLFTVETPRPMRFVGYAGRGLGRNNPDYQAVKNAGPLPRGTYSVIGPFDHARHGPVCFRLVPSDQAMFGRSGFLIHGDNIRGDASQGCIILPRHAREFIARHDVTTLHVVRLKEVKGAKLAA